AVAFPLARFCGRKFADLISICRAFRNPFLCSTKPDPDPRLQRDRSGCSPTAVYSHHVSDVSLVRWTSQALWLAFTAGRRSNRRGDWLCAIRHTRRWWNLLEDILSSDGCAWHRHGDYC